MSEHHEDDFATSEPDEAAPFKDDDFPADFFDDANEPATFEAKPMEEDFLPDFEPHMESESLRNGHLMVAEPPAAPATTAPTPTPTASAPASGRKRPVLILPKKAIPSSASPGGLIPWTLSVLAFVVIGCVVLFQLKPNESTGTVASVAPPTTETSADPAKAEAPAPTPTLAAAAAVTAPTATETVAAASGEMPKADAPTPAPSATAGSAAPASDAATEALAAEFKAAKESVETELKALSDKVDALPKGESNFDAKPIVDQLADQGKVLETLAGVPGKVDQSETKIGAVEESVKGLQTEIQSLKDELKKATETIASLTAAKPATATATTTAPAATEPVAATNPAPEPKPAADKPATTTDSGLPAPSLPAASLPDATASEYAAAADLFKAGKYSDAYAAFNKMAAADPKDARVFYYAALSNGSANNVWTGETETLINKGIDLEKAGTPKKPEIDAAFTGLLPQLKTWLDAYRARVGQ